MVRLQALPKSASHGTLIVGEESQAIDKPGCSTCGGARPFQPQSLVTKKCPKPPRDAQGSNFRARATTHHIASTPLPSVRHHDKRRAPDLLVSRLLEGGSYTTDTMPSESGHRCELPRCWTLRYWRLIVLTFRQYTSSKSFRSRTSKSQRTPRGKRERA